MGARVLQVPVLVRLERAGDVAGQAGRHRVVALRRFGRDVGRAEHDLGAVRPQQRLLLGRLLVGHHEDAAVALERGGDRQAVAGVAGRRLDDRAARLEQAGPLGRLDHRQPDPVLDRAARIEHLELGEDQRLARRRARGRAVRRVSRTSGVLPTRSRIGLGVLHRGRVYGRRSARPSGAGRGRADARISRPRSSAARARAAARSAAAQPARMAGGSTVSGWSASTSGPSSAASASLMRRASSSSSRVPGTGSGASGPGRARSPAGGRPAGRAMPSAGRGTALRCRPSRGARSARPVRERDDRRSPAGTGRSGPAGPLTVPSGIWTKTAAVADDRAGRRDVLLDRRPRRARPAAGRRAGGSATPASATVNVDGRAAEEPGPRLGRQGVHHHERVHPAAVRRRRPAGSRPCGRCSCPAVRIRNRKRPNRTNRATSAEHR